MRQIASDYIKEIEHGKRDFRFNRTPSANRLHISFFGRRNAGKSSVVNAITGQELSIVSQVLGTTTDPVKRLWNCFPSDR